MRVTAEALARFFDVVLPHMNKVQRRVAAGATSEMLGRGGKTANYDGARGDQAAGRAVPVATNGEPPGAVGGGLPLEELGRVHVALPGDGTSWSLCRMVE